MNKYENGKIYTIRCRNDDTLIYVGSTIQSLSQRWSGHKRNGSKVNPNMPLYQAVNDNWDDWYIELYEPFSCNNKEELNKREGEIIRLTGTLNKRISGRTQKEWFQDNADKIREQKKLYQQANADKIRECKKKWKQDNADKIREQTKAYNLLNADKRKENYQRKKLEKQQNITL